MLNSLYEAIYKNCKNLESYIYFKNLFLNETPDLKYYIQLEKDLRFEKQLFSNPELYKL